MSGEPIEDGAVADQPAPTGGNRWLLVVPLALFLILGVFLKIGIGKDPTKLPSVLIDKPVPDFDLESLHDEGARVTSEGMLGTAYLLNVWGSWCYACRIEHEVITRIASTGPVPVLGLNWKDERSEGLRWLAQFGDPYADSAYDPGGRTGIDFGVYGAPETFLIDRNGCIRYKHVGPLYDEIVDQEILPLAAELAGAAAGTPRDCG